MQTILEQLRHFNKGEIDRDFPAESTPLLQVSRCPMITGKTVYLD